MEILYCSWWIRQIDCTTCTQLFGWNTCHEQAIFGIDDTLIVSYIIIKVCTYNDFQHSHQMKWMGEWSRTFQKFQRTQCGSSITWNHDAVHYMFTYLYVVRNNTKWLYWCELIKTLYACVPHLFKRTENDCQADRFATTTNKIE